VSYGAPLDNIRLLPPALERILAVIVAHPSVSSALPTGFLKGINSDVGMQGQDAAGRERNILYSALQLLGPPFVVSLNSTAPESPRTKGAWER